MLHGWERFVEVRIITITFECSFWRDVELLCISPRLFIQLQTTAKSQGPLPLMRGNPHKQNSSDEQYAKEQLHSERTRSPRFISSFE